MIKRGQKTFITLLFRSNVKPSFCLTLTISPLRPKLVTEVRANLVNMIDIVIIFPNCISLIRMNMISSIGGNPCDSGDPRFHLSCHECGITPEKCRGNCYWDYFDDKCKEKSKQSQERKLGFLILKRKIL